MILHCAHCDNDLIVTEPFQLLNTEPLRCPYCQGLNALNIEDEESEDGPMFYLETT